MMLPSFPKCVIKQKRVLKTFLFFSGDSKKKATFRTHKSLAQKAIDAAQKSRSQSSPALLLPIQPLGKSLHSSIKVTYFYLPCDLLTSHADCDHDLAVQCSSGDGCVYPQQVCDGTSQCPDGSDERSCSCKRSELLFEIKKIVILFIRSNN